MSVITAAILRPSLRAGGHESLRQAARVLDTGEERSGAGLDVDDDGLCAAGDLLRHDRGDDERQRIDGGRDIAKLVEDAVGGDHVRGVVGERESRLPHEVEETVA